MTELLAGVILAAGRSERLGRPKQLLEYKGQTLVQHAVAQALPVCGAGVVLVTGAYGDEVADALHQQDVQLVHNPDWQTGMAGTLRAGVGALEGIPCEAALLLVCDQPRVTTAHLAALAALWQNAPSRAAAAAHAGQPGVPAIVPRSWFSQLMQLQGEEGARALLRESADTQLMELPEAAIDIDTPDDLKQLGQTPGQL